MTFEQGIELFDKLIELTRALAWPVVIGALLWYVLAKAAKKNKGQ